MQLLIKLSVLYCGRPKEPAILILTLLLQTHAPPGNYYSGKIRNYFGLYTYEQFFRSVSSSV